MAQTLEPRAKHHWGPNNDQGGGWVGGVSVEYLRESLNHEQRIYYEFRDLE